MQTYCLSCGSEVPHGSRFCNHCGVRMPAPRPGQDGPLDDHAAATASAGVEQRQTTVLACDLVGSTSLLQRLGRESYRDLVRQYQDQCVELVERARGSVASIAGDGFFAQFGATSDIEDAAERSIHAALGIIRSTPEIRADLSLNVRAGISTGVAIFGSVLSAGAVREREMIGDPPNLAARLQKLARPGSVVVDEVTRRVAGELFAYVDLGDRRIKGFRKPLKLFSVVRENVATTRFDARSGLATAPIVGRASELGRLRKQLRQCQTAGGRTVLVSGQAGIGKSRLIHDIRVSVSPEQSPLLACNPLRQNSPLYPLTHFLWRSADVDGLDDAETRFRKIEKLLSDRTTAAADIIQSITEYFSEISNQNNFDQQARQIDENEKICSALLQLLLWSPRKQEPKIIVVEDLQWIDPTTLELFRRLNSTGAGQPILTVLTVRGEQEQARPKFFNIDDHIHLSALDADAAAELSRRVAAPTRLTDTVVATIAHKASGVPLFVEELTKHYLETRDSGIQQLPATISGIINARLKRDERSCNILLNASAIGEQFNFDLLARITHEQPAELIEYLQRLGQRGLLKAVRRTANPTFRFQHALIREAAYNSLVRTDRVRLHKRIAVAIRSYFPTTPPEILAHHLSQADLPDEAIVQYRLAADRNRRRSANAEAAEQYRLALSLVRRLPVSDSRNSLEVDLLIAHGTQLVATQGNAADDVGRAYKRAFALASLLTGNPNQRFRIMRGLQTFHLVRGALARSARFGETLLALAERTGCAEQRLQAHRAHGLCLLYMGKLDLARQHLLQALRYYDQTAHGTQRFEYNSDPVVLTASHLCWVEGLSGQLAQAMAYSQYAMDVANRLNHPHSLAFALSFSISLELFAGQATGAFARASELIQLAKQRRYPYWLAWGRVMKGRASLAAMASDGLQEIETGLNIYRDTGSKVMLPYFEGLRAETLVQLGHDNAALVAFDKAEELARRLRVPFYQSEIMRNRASLCARLGAPRQDTIALLRRAAGLSRSQGAKLFECRILGDLLDWLGDDGSRKRIEERLRVVTWELQDPTLHGPAVNCDTSPRRLQPVLEHHQIAMVEDKTLWRTLH